MNTADTALVWRVESADSWPAGDLLGDEPAKLVPAFDPDDLSPAEDPELTTVEAYQQAVGELGVVGFNPHTDALRQPIPRGVRIHYYRDGEIRWVSRETVFGSDRWESPTTETSDEMKWTLTAADEFEMIDKRVHNWLVSGPLSDVDGVHGGICWGIALMFGRDIERGRTPTSLSLKIVPGVGDVLAGRIQSTLRNYPSVGEHQDD